MYQTHARENWTHKDENPPVGLILCAEKDAAVARYALEGLPNKVLAAEYRMALPEERYLRQSLSIHAGCLRGARWGMSNEPDYGIPGRSRNGMKTEYNLGIYAFFLPVSIMGGECTKPGEMSATDSKK